jgi:phospholipid-binding lipoprotein MlaA
MRVPGRAAVLYSRSPSPLALENYYPVHPAAADITFKNNMSLLPRLLSVILLSVVLGGCVGVGVRDEVAETYDEETWDPFEGFNRAMFSFNEKFDAWLLKPVAKGYDWALPGPVKSGVGNFFSNLFQPAVAVNDLLQGKPGQSARDTGRFVLNTTVGVFGLFDVAKSAGLEPKEEDWGQTFAVWGAGEGPYFVWPIIGPRYLRDTFGWGVDWVSHPVTYLDPVPSWSARSLEIVDTRARLLPAEKVLDQAAGDDKYIFIREAYRQRRRNLIYDGNPPKPKFFEDEPPANNSPAPPVTAPP